MAHVYTEEQNLVDIANAIREKNGTDNTYAPSEMASAIEELKVGELDFSSLYDQGQANELNQYYKDGIAYAEEIKRNWSIDRNKLIYLPKIDLSNTASMSELFSKCSLLQMIHPISSSSVITADKAFYQCSSLLSLNITLDKATTLSNFATQCSALKKALVHAPNNTNLYQAFQNCYNLSEIDLGDMPNVTNYQQAFENTVIKCINLITDSNITLYRTFYECRKIESVTLTSIKNLTTENSFELTFAGCSELITLKFSEWLKRNLSLSHNGKISPESIKYIIWHAMNGENNLGYENQGATSRTLTLKKANVHDVTWVGIKDTTPSVEDCEMLGIDETEITKYGNLTWAQIASDVKLITITA